MTKRKSVPNAGNSSNVAPMATAKLANVRPPEDWKLRGPHGFMRGKDADEHAVDLVSLDELLEWLQARHGIPSTEARTMMGGAWPEEGFDIFELHPDDYATRMLGNRTKEVAASPNVTKPQSTIKLKDVPPGTKTSLSISSFAKQIAQDNKLRQQVDELMNPQLRVIEPLAPPNQFIQKTEYAISHGLAHKLFGWGAASAADSEPTTWTELIEFRKRKSGSNFSVKQKTIIADERSTRGVEAGAAKNMADALDISVSRLNELIRKASQAGKRHSKRSKAA